MARPTLVTRVNMVYAPIVHPALDSPSSFLIRLPPTEAPLKAQKLLGGSPQPPRHVKREPPRSASEEPYAPLVIRVSSSDAPLNSPRLSGTSQDEPSSDPKFAPLVIRLPPINSSPKAVKVSGGSRTPDPPRPERYEPPRSVSEEPSREAGPLSTPRPMSRSETMFKSSTSLASLASDLATASAGWFSSLKRSPRRKKLERQNFSNQSGKTLARSAWELSSLGTMVCRNFSVSIRRCLVIQNYL